jgi:hypothetical protein
VTTSGTADIGSKRSNVNIELTEAIQSRGPRVIRIRRKLCVHTSPERKFDLQSDKVKIS